MPMYNLIEYSDAYSKISGSLQQYYRDEPALHNKGNIIDFLADNNSASFKFKQKITGQAKTGGIKEAQIMVPLKYLSNFWRTLQMPLINCEHCLELKWSRNCNIVAGTAEMKIQRFK